jgi:hypothetical protein
MMEQSETHSLALTFEDLLDDSWEAVYTGWQDDAVEQLKTKYGDRVSTIYVNAEDVPNSDPPTKVFSVYADLEPVND